MMNESNSSSTECVALFVLRLEGSARVAGRIRVLSIQLRVSSEPAILIVCHYPTPESVYRNFLLVQSLIERWRQIRGI